MARELTKNDLLTALIRTEINNYNNWRSVGNPMIPSYQYLNKEIIEELSGRKIEDILVESIRNQEGK